MFGWPRPGECGLEHGSTSETRPSHGRKQPREADQRLSKRHVVARWVPQRRSDHVATLQRDVGTTWRGMQVGSKNTKHTDIAFGSRHEPSKDRVGCKRGSQGPADSPPVPDRRRADLQHERTVIAQPGPNHTAPSTPHLPQIGGLTAVSSRRVVTSVRVSTVSGHRAASGSVPGARRGRALARAGPAVRSAHDAASHSPWIPITRNDNLAARPLRRRGPGPKHRRQLPHGPGAGHQNPAPGLSVGAASSLVSGVVGTAERRAVRGSPGWSRQTRRSGRGR